MRTVLAALALLVAACSQPPAVSQPAARAPEMAAPPVDVPADAGVFGQIPEVVQEVQPSVVAVFSRIGEGSGVIWDAGGIIVTNNHVVQGSDRVEVAFATGERVAGTVRAADERTDLAVVEVGRNGLPAARFADRLPRVGELAIALGNPLGFENTVTAGIISGLNRFIPDAARLGQPALVDLIQTDAPISPGNSGGALANGRGEVVGINIAYIPPQAAAVSIGFAVPSPTVIDVVGQLLETGQVRHAFLGIQAAELTPQVAERFGILTTNGVLVQGVERGTPAADAGLRPGDVIVSFNGDSVEGVGELLGKLRGQEPGDTVTLGVLRDSDEVELRVTLAERPQS